MALYADKHTSFAHGTPSVNILRGDCFELYYAWWGRGEKRIRCITFFRTLGTTRKKYPLPLCKKVSQPQFACEHRHIHHLLKASG